MSIYNGSVYGSNLYDMDTVSFKQLVNSFSVATREIWELPRETHRYIVGELAGLHLQTIVLSNKIGFYRRLRESSKVAVRNLYAVVKDNLRTVTGRSVRTIKNIGVELGLLSPNGDPIEMRVSDFKKSHRQVAVPEGEVHRISVLDDLLSIRSKWKYMEDDQFTIDDITCMIRDVCVS